jgi:hypothetical protein
VNRWHFTLGTLLSKCLRVPAGLCEQGMVLVSFSSEDNWYRNFRSYEYKGRTWRARIDPRRVIRRRKHKTQHSIGCINKSIRALESRGTRLPQLRGTLPYTTVTESASSMVSDNFFLLTVARGGKALSITALNALSTVSLMNPKPGNSASYW